MLRRIVLCAAAVAMLAWGAAAEDLIVGTYAEFPPFEYTDDDNNIIGFDMDVMDAIGREEGFGPQYSSQTFAALIEGLETNRLDIVASGLTITEARQKKVDFTDPYFDVQLVMVVRKGEPMVMSLEELKDKRVSILMGSTASVVVDKALGESAPNVTYMSKYNEVFSNLLTRRADVVLVDRPMARAYSEKMGGMDVGDKQMHVEQYGFAVRKGNKAVLDRLNSGLKKVKASGEFDRLVEKWFAE